MEFAKTMKVRITFKEEVLGTTSGNEELFEDYIASKAPSAEKRDEEIEAYNMDDQIDKAMTGFPRNEKGMPFLWDYQVKGFLKEAARAMKPIKGSETAKKKAFVKEIDLRIFVEPRQIPFNFKGFLGKCQRPLRASTLQGERVALAISETVPAGATCEFTIGMFDETAEDMVREWLDYGVYHGFGQWRNSGKGSFTWEEIK